MSIGIITFHDTNNFGSYLQTYGLYKKIIDLGYKCDIINYQCKAITEREDIRNRKFLMNPRNLLKEIFVNRILRNKYKELYGWLTSNAKISRRYDRHNISNASVCYDKFIVGSDIVWGMDIIEGDTAYFLDFEKDTNKKFAFASSVGNPWSDQEKTIVAPLLRSFSSIAVREEESAQWVCELTGIKPDVVCDPTMLLSSEEWIRHSSNRYDGKKYVLVYFPTDKNLKDAKRYADYFGVECYLINYGLPVKGFKSVKPTTICDFLSLFRNATFVSTASYHGMLFSIYFNRNFAYYNRAHKSRMNTLADKLQVTDRDGSHNDIINMAKIDYSVVNKAVEEYRNKSIECLKNILNK